MAQEAAGAAAKKMRKRKRKRGEQHPARSE